MPTAGRLRPSSIAQYCQTAPDDKWIALLNDTLRTCVAGFGQVRISEMARRTYELSRIMRWGQKRR